MDEKYITCKCLFHGCDGGDMTVMVEEMVIVVVR
jgi:hypothetical protein